MPIIASELISAPPGSWSRKLTKVISLAAESQAPSGQTILTRLTYTGHDGLAEARAAIYRQHYVATQGMPFYD